MSINLHRYLHWPPSILAVAVVLLIGGVLLIAAIAMRRKYATVATLVLLFAALWNGALVFAFMSPHNRHVFHLSTHRESVFVNAAVGIVWFSPCVFCVAKWFHGSTVREGLSA